MKYIQHPVTNKLVPADEVDWQRYATRSFNVMPDVEPFVSPIDQSVIGSRSALREHNKRHGVVNYHEFDGYWEAKRAERISVYEGTHAPTKKDRINDIKTAIEKVESNAPRK